MILNQLFNRPVTVKIKYCLGITLSLCLYISYLGQTYWYIICINILLFLPFPPTMDPIIIYFYFVFTLNNQHVVQCLAFLC